MDNPPDRAIAVVTALIPVRVDRRLDLLDDHLGELGPLLAVEAPFIAATMPTISSDTSSISPTYSTVACPRWPSSAATSERARREEHRRASVG